LEKSENVRGDGDVVKQVKYFLLLSWGVIEMAYGKRVKVRCFREFASPYRPRD
jgi:hypothetical protein